MLGACSRCSHRGAGETPLLSWGNVPLWLWAALGQSCWNCFAQLCPAVTCPALSSPLPLLSARLMCSTWVFWGHLEMLPGLAGERKGILDFPGFFLCSFPVHWPPEGVRRGQVAHLTSTKLLVKELSHHNDVSLLSPLCHQMLLPPSIRYIASHLVLFSPCPGDNTTHQQPGEAGQEPGKGEDRSGCFCGKSPCPSLPQHWHPAPQEHSGSLAAVKPLSFPRLPQIARDSFCWVRAVGSLQAGGEQQPPLALSVHEDRLGHLAGGFGDEGQDSPSLLLL